MEGATAEAPTRWREVFGIASILVALGVGWTAYGFCQPRILVGYGLATLGPLLLVAQGLLGIVMEPLMGAVSDRILVRTGSRFIVITLGVTVAGVVFVAVAAVLRGAPPAGPLAGSAGPLAGARGSVGHYLIPPLMIVWLAAMNAIRTPTFALLRQATPSADDLPRASAVLGLVSACVGALGPVVVALLDRIGDSPTFIAGGVLIALAAFHLSKVIPPKTFETPETAEGATRASFSRLLLIAVLGTAIALLLRTQTDAIVPALVARTGRSLTTVQALWAFVPAVFAMFLADVAKARGASFVLTLGLFSGVIALFAPLYLAALVAIVASAAIGASAVALVLTIATANAGVATGAYFAGFSAAFLLLSFTRVPPIVAVVGALIAFVVNRVLARDIPT